MAKKRKLGVKSESQPTNALEQEQHQTSIDEDKVREEDRQENFQNSQGTEQHDETLKTENGSNATDTSETSIDGYVDEDNDDSEEPLEKLIEPFSKDQLVDLLREASEKHPNVLERIREVADVDPLHRKIFVHGLGWDTNAETLTNVFKEYGEIEDCKAVCDKISGKSKGYAFILFKHRSGACKALKEPQKRIGNRMTACQLASAGPVPPPVPAAAPASEYTQRKIYVSNVSAEIDPQKLLSYFAKYGEIVEGPLGLDKQTGKPKGFTLFVYKSIESAKKALEEPHKNFEGHILHCQKAVDGPKPNKPYYHQKNTPESGHGSHYSRSENSNFVSGIGSHGSGVPSSAGVPFNQGVSQLNPVQALTTLIASQGGGLGLTNFLGTLGSTGMGTPGDQSVSPIVNSVAYGMQGGYANQPMGSNISPSVIGGGYGNYTGYPNPPISQNNAGRSQRGGNYMGGYMGH